MIRKNLSEYFMLGKRMWYLADLRPNTTKEWFDKWVRLIYDYCDKSWFVVSRDIMEKLFNPIITGIETTDNKTVLEPTIIQSIKDAMNNSNNVIDSESNSKIIYELCNPWVAEVKKLIDEPEAFIPQYDKLDDVAKNDWKEWCKSLAYLLPTATIFYLMRVIEWLTYRYCLLFSIKQKEDKNTGRVEWMWGVLQRLKDKYESNKIRKNKNLYKKEIVFELITIKDFYRNPTNHPNVVYTQEQASDLFNRSISIINGLLKKLK